MNPPNRTSHLSPTFEALEPRLLLSGQWQQAVVDNATFYNGEIGQVAVADARNDGTQRIYCQGFVDDPDNTSLYESSWSGGAWHTGLVGETGGPAWPEGPVLSVGDGRNDGRNRIYSEGAWYNTVEFSYLAGSWAWDTYYEGGHPYEPTVGAGRGDSVNRLYCPGQYVACELTYDAQSGGWDYMSLPDGPTSGGVQSVCVASPRGGADRVYASWAGGVYEYQWNGAAFARSASAIGQVGSSIEYLVSGDGRNSGVDSLYCGAVNGHVYEVRWAGANWQTIDLGLVESEPVESIAIGPGRNDGFNRVYAGSDVYCYEFTFSGGTWGAEEMVGEGGRVALGDARGDGVTRVYAGDSALYEYTWPGQANHAPQVSNGSVNPVSGDSDTNFYWYADYYDEDGNAPATKKVYIDGVGYTMSLYSGSPADGRYRYGPKNLGAGGHDYYFYFADGQGGNDRFPEAGTISGPNVTQPGLIYVDDDYTPSTAGWGVSRFVQIQDGIDAAQSCGTVLVFDGIYKGDGNRDLDFHGEAMTLRSLNGPENCIIDCEGSSQDPHRGFYFHSGETESSVVDGFTITNGYTDTSGGAVAVKYGASPAIRNNWIIGNVAVWRGGGIYCYNSSPVITGNTITDNWAQRYGGGIACTDESRPAISGNIVSGNRANSRGGGISAEDESFPDILNCLISGNSAFAGGGVWSQESFADIANCTVTGNKAAAVGGGVYWEVDIWGWSYVENSILWGNSAGEGEQIAVSQDSGSCSVKWCDLQDGEEGVYKIGAVWINSAGTVNSDPKFVAPGHWDGQTWVEGDYHLLPHSPCIDGGAMVELTPATDIEGNPRYDDRHVPNPLWGDYVDMGAYERQSDSGPAEPKLRIYEDTGAVNDDALPFGAVGVGNEVAEYFAVWNGGNGSLTVTQVKMAGPGASAFSIETPNGPGSGDDANVARGDTLTVGVLFRPNAAREYLADLIIYSNDPATPERVLTLSGQGHNWTPDLVISDTALVGPAVVPAGETVQVRVTTHNAGAGDAVPRFGDYFETALFLSKDLKFDSRDQEIEGAEYEMPRLNAGQSYPDPETTITFTAPTEPGTYYLAAVADEFNSVKEENEKNNWSEPIELTVQKRVIIDMDPSFGECDPDDVLALIYAAQSPNCHLEGLTVGWGNMWDALYPGLPIPPHSVPTIQYYYDETTEAIDVLGIAGALTPDLPVRKGAAFEQTWRMLEINPTIALQTPAVLKNEPVKTDAVDFICGTVSEHPGAVTVIAQGTLTNLASAMYHYKGGIYNDGGPFAFMKDVGEIWITGGAVGDERSGNVAFVGGQAEYNIWRDPEAAEYVFAAVRDPIKVRMVPLDATMDVSITDKFWKQLIGPAVDLGLPVAEYVYDTVLDWMHTLPNLGSMYPFDTIGVALALDGSLAERVMVHKIRVDTGGDTPGRTVADNRLRDRERVRVYENFDEGMFRKRFFQRMIGPPHVETFDEGLADWSAEGNVQIADDGTGQNNVGRLQEGSDAAISQSVDLPISAGALAFEYHFAAPGDGDTLEARIDGDVVWTALGTDYEGTALLSSGPIDVSGYAGRTVDLELRLHSVGDVNCEVWLDNVTVLEGQRISFGGRDRAEFTDESGDRVTVSLAGPGTGEVYLPPDGEGDAAGIVLFGTTDRSSLTILAKGAGARTTVGDILVDGSLRSLTARTTDLLGDLEVTGSLGSLMLGDVADHDQQTIRIGPSDSPKAGTSMTFGLVENLTIDSATPIRSLRAIAWLDNDLTPDVIDAPSVGTLTISGQRGNPRRGTEDVPGDFQADLALSGEGDPRQTLTNASIAGSLTGAAWDITGDVGTVSVSGEADGWTLDVHSDVRSLRLGDVTNTTVTVDGALGTLSALRWAGGGVTAKTLRSLNVAGRRGNARRGTEDVPGDFGVNLTLTGDPGAKQVLGSARISGELHDSAWDITGPVGSVTIGHIATSLHLPDVSSISTSSLLIRWLHGDLPVGLIAVEGAGQVNDITFDSIRRWPKTTCDLVSEVGDPPPVAPTVFGAMTLASLKNHLGSALGRWTGDPSRLRPGLLASFDRTKDPAYRSVQRAAFVYDNALAIETLLMGNNPDAECRARAFQIADALVLLQDHDPNNAGAAADPEFPALTPAPLRDAYQAGTVATSRDATKITVRTAGFDNASSGNQAYAAMALVRAADVADEHGEADRAADYRKTAKELLLYVGRNRSQPDPLRGFAMSEDAAIGQARATEHNIDLAAAFGRMADAEADPALKAKWEAWRDWADHFRNQMYGANERFAELPWISDDWQYFRVGTGLADDINKDLVSLDTGAWSSLGRGDDRDVAFDLLEFLAASTDATGRTYTGFDPGFRAVDDDSLTSRRDGIGSEATAYMALIARKLGDGAILAALPGRATLTADEQAAYDLVLGKANDGETDHDLADFLVGELVNIQLHAPNGDGLGLVAAPVPGVGTGEYDLVNGWALASTCWARFAFQGWNVFTGGSTG